MLMLLLLIIINILLIIINEQLPFCPLRFFYFSRLSSKLSRVHHQPRHHHHHHRHGCNRLRNGTISLTLCFHPQPDDISTVLSSVTHFLFLLLLLVTTQFVFVASVYNISILYCYHNDNIQNVYITAGVGLAVGRPVGHFANNFITASSFRQTSFSRFSLKDQLTFNCQLLLHNNTNATTI